MADADFISALGRLLHSGDLRDAFAADPAAVAASLSLQGADRTRFMQLDLEDVEFQARVLLRKRFNLVRRALPLTCARLSDNAWAEFQRYGRPNGPTGSDALAYDCCGFCNHLINTKPEAIERAEWNRAKFARDRRRSAVHWLKRLPVRGRNRVGLQIFFSSKRRAHDWRIAFGF